MNKKDCNIIFDLFPSYIENDVTDDTKEFIENHLKGCENCRKILNDIKNDNIDNQLKNDKNTEIEIEKIKKVKRNFKIHKMILLISSIIALIVAFVLIFNAMHNKTDNANKTLYDRITAVYKENKNLDNYRFIMDYKYIIYNEKGSFSYLETTNYKNGEFKTIGNTDMKDTGEKLTDITYGKIDSSDFMHIDLNDKTITKNLIKDDIVNSTKYAPKLLFRHLLFEMRRFEDVDYDNVEIKIIDGKEWYYIKYGTDEDYAEYWLDKDNLTDFKYVEVDPKYYRECSYKIEKNVVTDEDVATENTEKYQDYTYEEKYLPNNGRDITGEIYNP